MLTTSSATTSAPAGLPAPHVVAARALAALGTSADTVAAALAAAGFSGVPIKADRCPLGRYVRASDARITDVSVASDVVRVYTGSGTTPGRPVNVPLPEAVRAFLGRFDAGCYPNLIAPAVPTAEAVPPELGTVDTPEPVRYPMPRPDDDPRFTFGLIHQVGTVLAEHGYPPIRTGADHVRLQQALFGFLYTPTPAAAIPAEVSPQPAAPACPGTAAGPAEVATSPHLFVTTGRHA